jgi:hypothetical protein
VAYCSFSQTILNKMEWLGGSGYNHIGLYIHGVEYVQSDGCIASGTYTPVLFEDLADPIISGREELGMPKVYSSIGVSQGVESYRMHTSWQEFTWGDFHLEGLTPDDNASGVTAKVSGENDDGILFNRYIPTVGRPGEAEAQYTVFAPFAEEKLKPVTQRTWTASKAHLKNDALDWDALPTLHHVISRLQKIPVYEVVKATVGEGTGVPDIGAVRRIF